MNFSDLQIDVILEKTESALTAMKIKPPVQKGVIMTLKTYLKNGSAVEDVCYHCLGTGQKLK